MFKKDRLCNEGVEIRAQIILSVNDYSYEFQNFVIFTFQVTVDNFHCDT